MHKIWLSKKKWKYFSLKFLSFSYFLMKSSLLKWGKYRIKRSIYFAMFRQKFLFKRFFVIFINILTNLIIDFAFYSCASDLSLDAYLDALPCNQENPVYDLMYICTWRHVCMFSACYQDEKQCDIIHLVYAKYVWLNLIAAFKNPPKNLQIRLSDPDVK